MDKSGDKKRVVTKQLNVRRVEEDRLSNLPESLLCQIMLNLPTIEVVQSCVLSKRWKNLWRYVPRLDVKYYIQNQDFFVSFVNMFLGLNRESCFQSCSLVYSSRADESNLAHVSNWINNVVNRKVKNLLVSNYPHVWSPHRSEDDYVNIPMAVYTCESLVSLDLSRVILVNPKLISLPCVKVIELVRVKFANALVLEKLISSCPVLESIVIVKNQNDKLDHLRVCSKSLQRFKYDGITSIDYWNDFEFEIDAPKLEYLRYLDLSTVSFRIKNLESLVEAAIDLIVDKGVDSEDVINLKKNTIRDLLHKISYVKKLSISTHMVQVFCDDMRCGRCSLPLFHNLSFLEADFTDCSLKMLSTFLESCPNLKSLFLIQIEEPSENVEDGVRVVSFPKCLSTSLEYVTIQNLITWDTREMNLVSYFLENSAILKKLTLHSWINYRKKKESAILKELLTITRLSTSCQVVFL